METNNELIALLRAMGIKTQFKSYREPETGAILLQARRPAKIVNGRLDGEQIDLYCETPLTFRVWTPRTKKAKACSARYGLHIRLLDGECELFVPSHLADTLLREFGAKAKRAITAEQRNNLRAFSFKSKHAESAQEPRYSNPNP